ncbi:hypothetical protein JB92DRAFT_3031061 [Gautieria morchelliformis]|nr:hypothetical protein JB92DRAFT_3031061 [Gautieria morchelliformis]
MPQPGSQQLVPSSCLAQNVCGLHFHDYGFELVSSLLILRWLFATSSASSRIHALSPAQAAADASFIEHARRSREEVYDEFRWRGTRAAWHASMRLARSEDDGHLRVSDSNPDSWNGDMPDLVDDHPEPLTHANLISACAYLAALPRRRHHHPYSLPSLALKFHRCLDPPPSLFRHPLHWDVHANSAKNNEKPYSRLPSLFSPSSAAMGPGDK